MFHYRVHKTLLLSYIPTNMNPLYLRPILVLSYHSGLLSSGYRGLFPWG